MAYVQALKGYITDVPEIWLKRNDNKVFHFDQISSSNVTPQMNFNEVNGGWSLFPVAYLPAASTMEMTFESAQFDADLFAMANNREFKTEEIEVYNTYTASVTANDGVYTATITTPASITGATVYIDGLTATTESDIGETEFKVGDSEAATDGASYNTVITFGTDPAVDVSITVITKENHETVQIDNQSTFVGECILKYPVYSSGEEAGISVGGVKGYVLAHIYKCRCTQSPGFDTSYKNAVTNGITVATMDPHRNDGAIYSISYVEA